MTRYDIIQKFIDERQFKSFLEIGTFNGDTFKHITIDHIITINSNIIELILSFK